MLTTSMKICFVRELVEKLLKRDIWVPAISRDREKCQYRLNKQADGLACFAGLFIPDSRYNPQFDFCDGEYVMCLEDIIREGMSFPNLTEHDTTFIQTIQRIHDQTFACSDPEQIKEYWLNELDRVIDDLTAFRGKYGD